MKKYILLLLVVCASITAKAQTNYNFARFAIGVDGSLNRAYTNVAIEDDNRSYDFNVNYFFTPFIQASAEYQFGNLSGGSITKDRYKRAFKNAYKAIVFHSDMQLGEIIDYENDFFLSIAKNLYAGTGIGMVSNNVDAQRYSIDDPTYKFPGSDKSTNLMVPLRIGYELKIFNTYGEPFLGLHVGYTHNVVFGGGLDGYNDPSSHFKNNALNQYRQIEVGIKVIFGSISSYDRQM